jgi:glycosyltransferase involved in cell wall biosynthesis
MKECRTLSKAGYIVTLLVPHEREEVRDKVQIRRIRKPRNRFERMLRTVWLIYRRALKEKAELYHFHDPELIPVGLLLKIFTTSKVVYDIHEDYPLAILSKYWIPPLFRKVLAYLFKVYEDFFIRFFDAIVPATPSISKRFELLNRKTITVQNFPIPNELIVQKQKNPWQKRIRAAAYVGGIDVLRGAKEMVQAIYLASQEVEAFLILAGNFTPETLRDEIKNMPGWQKVRYKGFISREEVAEMLGQVKLGLLLLHPEPNHITSQPNKLFEYLSAGLPVVASDFPLWREIIDEVKCGLLVDPFDVKAIAEAIIWLLDNPKEAELMGKRGQKAVYQKFNWNTEADKLIACYNELIS